MENNFNELSELAIELNKKPLLKQKMIDSENSATSEYEIKKVIITGKWGSYFNEE